MKKLLASLLLIAGFNVILVAPTVGAATAEEELCKGAGLKWEGGRCRNNQGGPSVEQTIQNVVNVITFLAGGIAVIMIVIGGLRYVLSNGEQAQLTSAKNTIIYACVGLVVIIVAYAIVSFVIRYFA